MPSRSPAPSEDTARLRAAVVAAGRRLGTGGLIAAGEGNISVRLVGGQLLITPAGRRKDELAVGDLLVVAESTGRVAPPAQGLRPSSDIAIHRAIYAARPDVQAVVHAHLPAAMALTLAGQVPDPAVLPETALLLPRLPFVPFAAAGSEELAAAIAAALAEAPPPLPGAALLERHGAVAIGADAVDLAAAVNQALERLELVEVLCRTWRDAVLLHAAANALGARAILRPPSTSPGAPARGRTRRQ
jgi:ribulose-5-phosphate 4-epimerase/fuculose-1-phosphate aldolase